MRFIRAGFPHCNATKVALLAARVLAIWFIFSPLSVGQDQEALAQASEKAGRYLEALTQYASALQATAPGSDAEYRLLERAAAIAPKLRAAPPVPDEAERRFVRGQAIVKGAKDAEAFLRAADEFRAAVRAAPWLSDAYFNLGVVLDKAERHADAIRALKLYVLAAPSSKDAKEAQRLIYEIEVRQEDAQRAKMKEASAQAAKAEAARQEAQKQNALIASLNGGQWCEKGQSQAYGSRCASGGPSIATMRVSANANQLNISIDWRNGSFHEIRATIDGYQLRGTFTTRISGIGSETSALSGAIGPDGRQISISAKSFGGNMNQEFVRIN